MQKIHKKPKVFRQCLWYYLVFCAFVIIRGLLSSNPLIPLTRAASMLTIMVTVVCFFADIDNLSKCRNMMLGLVIGVDVLILYCFLFTRNGVTFDLTYDENLIGNKNTLGNYLFLGIVPNVLLLETKSTKLWTVLL